MLYMTQVVPASRPHRNLRMYRCTYFSYCIFLWLNRLRCKLCKNLQDDVRLTIFLSHLSPRAHILVKLKQQQQQQQQHGVDANNIIPYYNTSFNTSINTSLYHAICACFLRLLLCLLSYSCAYRYLPLSFSSLSSCRCAAVTPLRGEEILRRCARYLAFSVEGVYVEST